MTAVFFFGGGRGEGGVVDKGNQKNIGNDPSNIFLVYLDREIADALMVSQLWHVPQGLMLSQTLLLELHDP